MAKTALFLIIFLSLTACVYSRFVFAEMPNGDKIKLQTAITRDEFVRGLSGIEEPVDYDGMLFLKKFSEAVSFWMYQMKFPLDLVYLDENKVVKEIHLTRQPCVENQECPIVTSQTDDIRYILELKAELAGKFDIQVGSEIKW